ncbi:hypothetical protein chiPu_0017575 [Chiloscyllium punctatum]|uniref:Uncharacterized protein n=1 Tax=Chiloscyllium punctatum TaxID=137246 RepID=A0A401RH82_CHIPU|nr:hypothetical protein [Chiloscyllium punctatum]
MPLLPTAVLLLCALRSPAPSVAFQLQDTINSLREENLQLHVRVDNLTDTLRELRQLLWDYSRGKTSSLHHILCSHKPYQDAAQIVCPLQDLLFGCLALTIFWMQNLFH